MDKFWGNVQYGIGNYGLVSYSNPQNWGFCIFSVITHRSRAETTKNILAILVLLCKLVSCWGLSAGYQPRPQVVDRGTTARYGGQLRYI